MEKQKKVMKQKHRKGLWSPEEDQKLRDYILKYGHGCWSSIPISTGLQRNGKSCRLRWINYLRPGLKRGLFTLHEEEMILRLHRMLGNKWSQMAQHLPGRTDNEIKNFWHSYLKKKVANKSKSAAEHDQTKSNPNNNTAESYSLSKEQELATTQFSDPQKTSSSSHNVFFAEWLNLDVSNSLTTGIYENQPSFCADPSDIYSDMLQDLPMQSGDHGELNGRNIPSEETISNKNSTSYSNDIYGDMAESQMSESGWLEFMSWRGNCSSSDFLYI